MPAKKTTFSAYFFLKVHLHHFSMKNSKKEVTNSWSQGTRVTLTNGSGWPKNIRIRRIRILRTTAGSHVRAAVTWRKSRTLSRRRWRRPLRRPPGRRPRPLTAASPRISWWSGPAAPPAAPGSSVQPKSCSPDAYSLQCCGGSSTFWYLCLADLGGQKNIWIRTGPLVKNHKEVTNL